MCSCGKSRLHLINTRSFRHQDGMMQDIRSIYFRLWDYWLSLGLNPLDDQVSIHMKGIQHFTWFHFLLLILLSSSIMFNHRENFPVKLLDDAITSYILALETQHGSVAKTCVAEFKHLQRLLRQLYWFSNKWIHMSHQFFYSATYYYFWLIKLISRLFFLV